MLDLMITRMFEASGTTMRIIAASLLILVLDLASAVYVMEVFKYWGQAGFTAFAAAITGGLLVVLGMRISLAMARHRAAVLLFAGGPEGNLELARLPLRIGAKRRAGAMAAAESVVSANSPTNFTAILELPTAAVFLAMVFVVAGGAAGGATSGVLFLYVIFTFAAGRRTDRLSKDAMRSKAIAGDLMEKAKADALAEAEAEMAKEKEAAVLMRDGALAAGASNEAIETALHARYEAAKTRCEAIMEAVPRQSLDAIENAMLDAYDARARMDSAAANDRNVGVLFSGLVLAAAIGAGSLFSDHLAGGTGALIAGNILAGRAMSVLTAGMAALTMLQRIRPVAESLLSEGKAMERRSFDRRSGGAVEAALPQGGAAAIQETTP